MKLLKLTAFFTLLAVLTTSLVSCEKDKDKEKSNLYVKTGIVMSGANENPAVATNATGVMDVWYDKKIKILNYVVSWSGLSTAPIGFHIHGLAPQGYNASVLQNFPTAGLSTSGTYQGTLLIDGVKFKENDILNGMYYINMHTTPNPGGEIRGQIRFQ